MPLAGGGSATAGAGRKRPAPARVRASRWLACLACILGIQVARADCPPDRIDERVRVSAVIDGDTLVLGDHRRVRLIGIDTPELGTDGGAHEAGALEARNRLRQLMFTHQWQISLRFDRERKDRYGRLLAHAFLADGRNLTEQLLETGSGSHLVVPPNTWQADCYASASARARTARNGIWALPEYAPVLVQDLGLREQGFRLVRGRVSHVSSSASAVWINLAGNFAARIEHQDIRDFAGVDLDGLAGADVELQGWVYVRKGQPRMRLRHPTALTILSRPLPPEESNR